jgi:hypothetical protein
MLGRAFAWASRSAVAIVAACLFMLGSGDGLDDYMPSYSAKTETSSRRSYSRGRLWGAEKGNDALRVEELGKGGDGEGYVWTERRQDKAAGQMPVRSVSTPRYGKQLGGAPALPHGCTGWMAFPSAIVPSGRAGNGGPRAAIA